MAMNFDMGDDDPDEGEPWLASFADMMSLLLGFFMILYSMSHMDEKKFYEFGKSIAQSFKKEKTKEQVKALDEMTVNNRKLRAFQMLIAVLNLGEEEGAVAKVEKLYSQKVQGEQAKDKVMSRADEIKEIGHIGKRANADDETVINLIFPTTNLFEAGTNNLSKNAPGQLVRLADILLEVKGLGYFEITGHTDSLPPKKGSGFTDNWTLSAARAATVAKALTKHGIEPGKFRVRGMASYEPLFPEFGDDGKAIVQNMVRNRRIEVAVKKAL